VRKLSKLFLWGLGEGLGRGGGRLAGERVDGAGGNNWEGWERGDFVLSGEVASEG
jgi:hypothetical protein